MNTLPENFNNVLFLKNVEETNLGERDILCSSQMVDVYSPLQSTSAHTIQGCSLAMHNVYMDATVSVQTCLETYTQHSSSASFSFEKKTKSHNSTCDISAQGRHSVCGNETGWLMKSNIIQGNAEGVQGDVNDG